MRGRLFWPAASIGWTLMAVGFAGVAGESRDVPPLALGRWVVGLALLHDLAVAPLVLGAGALLHRLVRARWRWSVSATFVAAAPVVLFAWPFVAGWGRSRANPSIQPRDYGDGLVVVLAVLALAGAVAAAVDAVTSRRARRACPGPPAPSPGPCP